MKTTCVAPLTANRSKPNRSPEDTVVVVKSVSVVEVTKFPEERDTPLVLIEFAEVGFELPDATFQTSTVAVPLSAWIDQLLIVHDALAVP